MERQNLSHRSKSPNRPTQNNNAPRSSVGIATASSPLAKSYNQKVFNKLQAALDEYNKGINPVDETYVTLSSEVREYPDRLVFPASALIIKDFQKLLFAIVSISERADQGDIGLSYCNPTVGADMPDEQGKGFEIYVLSEAVMWSRTKRRIRKCVLLFFIFFFMMATLLAIYAGTWPFNWNEIN